MTAKKPNATGKSDTVASARLKVLELAAQLGNAAEACRRLGVDRTSFYQWRHRYRCDGLPGLQNRPRGHHSHPQTTPADVSRRVVSLALANPAEGCDRIAVSLARAGIDLSSVTIQKILNQAGLGVYETRAAAIEKRFADGHRLNTHQIQFLEDMNPCFRERELHAERPGALLIHGIFFLGRFEKPGVIYAHVFIDRASSYTFCNVTSDTRIVSSTSLLQDAVLPFFKLKKLEVRRVLGCQLSETSTQALSNCVRSLGLDFSPATTKQNGFVEQYRRVAMSEFVRRPFARRVPHAGLTRFQKEMADFIDAYNETRPQPGYPNYGATPASRIERAIRAASEEA